jgi:pSer/pThr/pTyr-binding forkhead associated (FHA) protein
LITCNRCGKENQDHYKFCLGCGSELAKAQPAAPAASSEATPPPIEAPAASPPQAAELARTALPSAPDAAPAANAAAGEIKAPDRPSGPGPAPAATKQKGGIPWNDSPKMPAHFTPQPTAAAVVAPAPAPAIGTGTGQLGAHASPRPGSSPSPMFGTPIAPMGMRPSGVTAAPAATAAKPEGVICPTCGKSVAPGFAFCGSCGSRIDKPAARPVSGQQRTMHMAAGAIPPAAAAPRGRLVLIRPDGSEGGVHALVDGENLIGRGQGALFDADAYLSPRHGEFTINGPNLTVRDLRSLNGVFLKITKEEALESGDVFRIGQELLRFEVISPPQPLEDGTEIMGTPNPGFWGRLSVVVGRDLDGSAFPLFGDSIVLGRERGDILFPEDGYVSGTHARISLRDGQVFLTDLGSSNGTFLRIRAERQVPTGAFVLMGQQLFRIEFR